MQDIIKQLIYQIEKDGKLTPNTKASYKSDLNELLDYSLNKKSKVQDINQAWVKEYLKHLEDTNREKNSYNRRASTFRTFLKHLYLNKLAPTNYALIVNNATTFNTKKDHELKNQNINEIIENAELTKEQKIILYLICETGLSATQIVTLNTYQVDFENKSINISDREKVILSEKLFNELRDYLLNVRCNLIGADKILSLFLDELGLAYTEDDIYKLVKKLSTDLNLEGKFTTRNLKNTLSSKKDFLSMQEEVLSVISSN